jgi:hypothetical protein
MSLLPAAVLSIRNSAPEETAAGVSVAVKSAILRRIAVEAVVADPAVKFLATCVAVWDTSLGIAGRTPVETLEAAERVTIAERLVIWLKIVVVVPVGTDTEAVGVDLAVMVAICVAVLGISLGIAGKTPVETLEAAVETLAIPVVGSATWREFVPARDSLVLVLVLVTNVVELATWLVTVIGEEAAAAAAVASVSPAARKVTLQGNALRLRNKKMKRRVMFINLFVFFEST